MHFKCTVCTSEQYIHTQMRIFKGEAVSLMWRGDIVQYCGLPVYVVIAAFTFIGPDMETITQLVSHELILSCRYRPK